MQSGTENYLPLIWCAGVIITFIGLALLQRTYPKYDRDSALENSILAILWPLALCGAFVGICCGAVGWMYDKLSGAHHD